MQGNILGSRYRVIEYIAKGGFGKTYLAEDTQLPAKNKCVVKQLYPSVNDPNFIKVARRLFKKEAETLNTLGIHNHIPQLLAYFEESEKFYLVQQYVEGNTLSTELITGKTWSEAKVVNLLQDCLNILNFIHAEGVIHRDVKPDNLIRRQSDNKLVLVDFGTVKEVIIEQTQLVPSTVAVGTRGYMPTEQARGKPRITSDIYALGIIAIQALTGVHATKLEENDNGEIVWQNKAQCSEQLKEIVSKMTRYHFKERYQSAQETIAALASLENKSAAAIPPTEVVQVQYTPTVQLNDTELANLSRMPQATSSNPSAFGNDRPIPATAVNVADSDPQPTELSAENPQQSKSITKSNSFKNESNSRSKSRKSQKNLAALGTALAVGAIASGGMYFLNRNPTPTVEKPTPPVENPTPIVANPTPPVQKSIEEVDAQSEQLLAKASKLYEQEGNLEEAISTIQQIPQDSGVSSKAIEAQNSWQADYKTNEAIIMTAEQALSKEQWQEAKEQATKVRDSSSSIYWQEKANAIVSQAEEGIATISPADDTAPPTSEIQENPVPIIDKTPEPAIESPEQKITAPPETTTRSKGAFSNPKPKIIDPINQDSPEPLRDLDGNSESLPDESLPVTPADSAPQNNGSLRDL